MMERNEQIIALRAEGKTYGEIAYRFGISRQRAHQIANSVGRVYSREVIMRIPFVGLRKWMLENEVSMAELSRRCGVAHLDVVYGKTPREKTKAKILKVTGLTREECFRRDGV